MKLNENAREIIENMKYLEDGVPYSMKPGFICVKEGPIYSVSSDPELENKFVALVKMFSRTDKIIGTISIDGIPSRSMSQEEIEMVLCESINAINEANEAGFGMIKLEELYIYITGTKEFHKEVNALLPSIDLLFKSIQQTTDCSNSDEIIEHIVSIISDNELFDNACNSLELGVLPFGKYPSICEEDNTLSLIDKQILDISFAMIIMAKLCRLTELSDFDPISFVRNALIDLKTDNSEEGE